MPKPSDYTPKRRLIMQVVMTLILVATVALAAAVGAAVRRAARVELSGESVTANDVTVRLPAGWRTRRVPNHPGVVVQAIEDGGDGNARGGDRDDARRTVTVRVERLQAPVSPLQYLFAQFDFATDAARHNRDVDDPLATLPMAGQTGVTMTMLQGTGRRGGAIARKDIVAAVVLPSQRGVAVHLEGPGDATANDRAVVREIAAAIRVANEPQLGAAGDVVTLVDGIRFTAPPGLAPVPQTDANRTDRRLWPTAPTPAKVADGERHWLAVETVGCLCPDFDPADPIQLERAKQTLATLLIARDTAWRGATVTSIGNKVWRAEPARSPEGGGAALPARAFLRTDPSGRALLAVVRRGYGQEDFDPTWNQLAASVEFLEAADVANLEDVGAAEAARLRDTGYEKLLADRDVAWWLWTNGNTHIGWSNVDFPGSRGLVGRKESRLRVPAGDRVSRLTHDFSYRDLDPQYKATVARLMTGAARDQQWVQTTTLEGGKLAMSFKEGSGSTPVAVWQPAPPPANFVPGALLPLVLGELSRDPMLLSTDSFPGREGIGPPQPLQVIVRPGENTTRTAEGESSPMRCVTAQVNGTGAVSRWYFRKTGELESVDWSGGVQQVSSDQKVVQNNFPKDDVLAP